MATVVLSAYTIAYPSITNRIRVDIKRQSDELIVASQTKDAPHPIRIWNFPGLPRQNYIFDMNQIDSDGNITGTNLAYFDVQPANLEGKLVRNDEQVFPGITPGFNVGDTEMYFDGHEVSGGGTESDLTVQYDDNVDIKTRAFTLSGTPNEGDQVVFAFSLNQLEIATPYLALDTQGNIDSQNYYAYFSGNVSIYNKINIYGLIDSASFNVTSDANFTTKEDIVDNVISKLIASGKTAVRYDSGALIGIKITGTTSAAGSSIVTSPGVPVYDYSIISEVLAGWTLSDLINDLLTKAQAENPAADTYNDGTYDGIKVVGHTIATGSVAINKSTGGGDITYAPDFRGWNINPERRNQPGTMIRDQEYEWDEVTGRFALLIEGDIFQDSEPYNIDFDPKALEAGGSVPVPVPSFTAKLITTDYTLVADDFGNKLIVEPAANYLELTLPDITSITDCLPVSIEVYKDIDCCVKIVTSDTVKFLWGKIFICKNESLRLYRFRRDDTTDEWRVDQEVGNYKNVGQFVRLDAMQSGLINCVRPFNVPLNKFQYARLFDYVQKLNPFTVVTYAAWNTGDNNKKFSLDDGTNFHTPHRLGLYSRGTYIDFAGTYYPQQVLAHKHFFPYGNNGVALEPPFGRAGFNNKYGIQSHDNDNDYWDTNDGTELAGANQLNTAGIIGTENRPNSYSINEYILI